MKMSKNYSKNELEKLYEELMKIKSDNEFVKKSGIYEYDGEIGIVPVILKEDPEEVKKRKERILKKKVSDLKRKMPELYKVIISHKE